MHPKGGPLVKFHQNFDYTNDKPLERVVKILQNDNKPHHNSLFERSYRFLNFKDADFLNGYNSEQSS